MPLRNEPIVRIPQRIAGSDIEFPPFEILFESSAEAHACLMAIVDDVCRELRAEGIDLPSAREFTKTVVTMWQFWQRSGYIKQAA